MRDSEAATTSTFPIIPPGPLTYEALPLDTDATTQLVKAEGRFGLHLTTCNAAHELPAHSCRPERGSVFRHNLASLVRV